MAAVAERRDKPQRKYRTKPQPVCPVHGIPMPCHHSGPHVRYCYCVHVDENGDRCEESVKQKR